MLIHILGFLVADQQQRGFEGDIILLKISLGYVRQATTALYPSGAILRRNVSRDR